MARFLTLAIAVAAVTMCMETTANAQYSNGYLFGSGIGANFGGHGFVRGYTPREQPPYFAKFPPVYYSHPVKRPYGFSPYAVPGGIAPAEMSYAKPTPVTVKNPFFKGDVVPVQAPKNKNSEIKNKSVRIMNPYVTKLVQSK